MTALDQALANIDADAIAEDTLAFIRVRSETGGEAAALQEASSRAFRPPPENPSVLRQWRTA
jgi:hypothetical protein